MEALRCCLSHPECSGTASTPSCAISLLQVMPTRHSFLITDPPASQTTVDPLVNPLFTPLTQPLKVWMMSTQQTVICSGSGLQCPHLVILSSGIQPQTTTVHVSSSTWLPGWLYFDAGGCVTLYVLTLYKLYIGLGCMVVKKI